MLLSSIQINGSQLAKQKSTFLACPCHNIYNQNTVGQKVPIIL